MGTTDTKASSNYGNQESWFAIFRERTLDWFTGTVRVDLLFQAPEPARVSGAHVTFEPGARTAWHTHPLGQTLIVTSGCGWAQREGGTIEEIRPGDVVWFSVSAGLFSIEKRPIAAIAYGYYHHTGQYDNGTRQSGNSTGIAYTPIDNDAAGHLFSLQLGLSYERTFAVEELGKPLQDSGSSGVFLHPGVVFSTNPRLQIFTLVSLPISLRFNSIDDRQLFRIGAGAIIILGHIAESTSKK